MMSIFSCADITIVPFLAELNLHANLSEIEAVGLDPGLSISEADNTCVKCFVGLSATVEVVLQANSCLHFIKKMRLSVTDLR